MVPNIRISATSPAPVAIVLASSAIATLPPASRSAMIPEPTTTASSSAVPSPSATSRRASVMAPPSADLADAAQLRLQAVRIVLQFRQRQGKEGFDAAAQDA